MTKPTIVEAAKIALQLIDRPANLKQIYGKILERSLYQFGAKDPLSVLRVQVERHCEETNWSAAAKDKVFSKDDNGFYSLLQYRVKPSLDNLISESSVDNLLLVQQLAKNLRQNTINQILERLYSLEPDDFESFCQRFLTRYGFENMVVTQRGRDGGIDVHGYLEVGISQLHVAAQCKRYKRGNKVSRPDISQFRGDIQGEYQQGIFITTSEFTQEAQEIAFKRGCVPIVLIDGQTLAEIMIDREIGVTKNNIPIYDVELDLI